MNKKFIFVIFFLLVTPKLFAGEITEKYVDSLFVIASSGELKYRDLVDPAIDQLASMGSEIVPHLVDKFTTKSARERLTIINILKKIGKEAVPYLISSLKNPNGLVVQRVCWALGDIKDSSAVEPLIEVTTHPRWQVRDEALGALGDIQDSKADDAVLYGLQDSVGQVRKSAAVSAGKLKILESTNVLIGRLGDSFYGARMSAEEALLKLDTSFVIDNLADSIHSNNHLVGGLSCDLLGKLSTDRAVEILYDNLQSSEEPITTEASLALIQADPKDLCGFRKVILQKVTDRLSLEKIESAIQAVDDEKKEPER